MRASSSPTPDLEEAAPLFAALGDPTRLQLLARLSAEGPRSTSHLQGPTAVSRQAISKHLEVLGAAGLVASSRHGRERIWAVQPARLAEAHAYLAQISAQWDAALERLQAFVEAPESE